MRQEKRMKTGSMEETYLHAMKALDGSGDGEHFSGVVEDGIAQHGHAHSDGP